MLAPPVLLPPAEALARIRLVAERLPVAVDVVELLTLRAAWLGLGSRGRISVGGSCRLLPAADGWVAVSLARPDDVAAVPAVVEAPVDPDDPWTALADFARPRPARAVADRCQLLGLPGAVLADPSVTAADAVAVHALGATRPAASPGRRVVDLSALWAGPLCARLLGQAGMEVIKVEHRGRPDGARRGEPRFYQWLHHGHRSVVLDFYDPAGRTALDELLGSADVVIDASRPRALRQLGIDPEHHLATHPGTTWVSITGYGRRGEAADRVAFGDDAAVAGGLVGTDHDGLPVFCGDAIADPLAGLVAAAHVLAAVEAGGGRLVEVAMAPVAAAVAGGHPC